MPTLNHNVTDLLKPHFSYMFNREEVTVLDGIEYGYYQSTIKFVAHIKPDFLSSMIGLFQNAGVGISDHDLQYFTQQVFNSATFCLEKDLIDQENTKGKVKISKASVTGEKIRISFELTQTTDEYQDRSSVASLFGKLFALNTALSSKDLPKILDGQQGQTSIRVLPAVVSMQELAVKLSSMYADLPKNTAGTWKFSQFDHAEVVRVRDLVGMTQAANATAVAYAPFVTSAAGVQTPGTVVAFMPRTAAVQQPSGTVSAFTPRTFAAQQPSSTVTASAPRLVLQNQAQTVVANSPRTRAANQIAIPQHLLMPRSVEGLYATVAPRVVSAQDSIAAHTTIVRSTMR